MTAAFDQRLVKVGILIDGKFTFFQDVDIRIQGAKYFSPTNNFCTVKISNMTREQRNWLLTNSSPVMVPGQERKPTFLTVDVGRQSYGTFRLFEGVVYTSSVCPPPDIGITFRSLVGSGFSSLLLSNSQGAVTLLSTISQSIATQCGLILKFNVTKDKQVANYCFTGNANQQILKLQEVGNVRVCIDNGTMIVTDQYGFNNKNGFVLSMETGMVSVPQATESGCSAQMLISPLVNIGDKIGVKSKINPSVNGDNYAVSGMTFDIANRDNPFFYNLVLSNFLLTQGTQ